MLLTGGVALVDGRLQQTRVRLASDRVTEIGPELTALPGERILDLAGDFMLPGFVDVHIHAFRGQDMMAGEAALRAMSRALYREGVAAFLPTTMSATAEETRLALAGIRAVMAQPERFGARVLGAHLEAPFLSPAMAGAQRSECLMQPDFAALSDLCGGLEGVRLLTLAPELPGSGAVIRSAVESGMVVSIGHSAATAEEVHRAADAGATHVTHTFNAQSPLHHRAPGVPGAALVDDRLYTEFIADGIHLHPDTVRLLVRAKGAQRAVAITDAMEAAGMPEGEYTLGGQAVTVRDREARLHNGTLAGSVLLLRDALQNLITWGLPPEDAARMCTQTPAESIGEKVLGRLAPGLPLPITRWSPDWRWRGAIWPEATAECMP